VSTGTHTVRHEWADGYRRFEGERQAPAHYRALRAQLEAITDELRRRVGGVYLLDDLAAEYGRSDVWAHRLLTELPPSDRWAPGLSTAVDAAFHLYTRGAQDYAP
jgi:hypothetical protein